MLPLSLANKGYRKAGLLPGLAVGNSFIWPLIFFPFLHMHQEPTYVPGFHETSHPEGIRPLSSHAQHSTGGWQLECVWGRWGIGGRGMLNRKEERGELGRRDFCHKEGLAHSSFLSCNNKQAGQEGTNSPSPVFIFPLPGASRILLLESPIEVSTVRSHLSSVPRA